jgi:hypothetical protein
MPLARLLNSSLVPWYSNGRIAMELGSSEGSDSPADPPAKSCASHTPTASSAMVAVAFSAGRAMERMRLARPAFSGALSAPANSSAVANRSTGAVAMAREITDSRSDGTVFRLTRRPGTVSNALRVRIT